MTLPPLRHLLPGLLAALPLAATTAWAQDTRPQAPQQQPVQSQDVQPEGASGRTEKKTVTAERFMVAAANPHAVEAGYNVLTAGGNAVDAMVAVQLMLNLTEPQSSGIGGGAFLLYWDAGQRQLLTFDSRETAPAAATPDYWLNEAGEPMDFWEALVGGRSVGVPGTLKLLEVTHNLYGSMPWPALLQPVIEMAEQGFEISPRLAGAIADAQQRELDKYPVTRDYFFNGDGTPKAAGTTLSNPEFADTLRLIAEAGSAPFYRGAIAEEIVAAVTNTADNPGIMTLQDLADYQVKLRAPVCTPYRAYQVCGMGPPTSGGLTVGQILGVLEHFDILGLGLGPESVHLYLEAAKLAYADRAMYMADSDFVRMPLRGLLDPTYLTVRAQQVARDRAMAQAEAGNPPWRAAQVFAPDRSPERPGTSHFVIVDAEGNAVSMTTTIETGFGSRLMVRGFLLNNELTDFSFAPEEDGRPVANRVEGGKRPRSSMSPTMVFQNDAPMLLIGSPGGSRIINYVAKSIVAILDWDMDIQQAIGLGHFVNRNGATDLEEGTDIVDLQAPLEALGHEINVRDLNSGLHGILIRDGQLHGGADPRREGIVMGE